MIAESTDENSKAVPPGEAAAAAASQPSPAPEKSVAKLEAQIADLTDRLLRAHAEMDNMRKRAEKERLDTQKYANSKFANDVLVVGDNLRRALASAPELAKSADAAVKSLLEGVAMTERELVNALARHGVKRIDPKGEPFNPHLHQAVMEQQNADVPAGTVLQVFEAGYVIEDRVLRPAMVVVAKGGAKPARPVEEAQTGAAVPPAANDDRPQAGESRSGTAGAPGGDGFGKRSGPPGG